MKMKITVEGKTYDVEVEMLDQHEGDAGSASSLMGSAQMVMGSIGMVIASLQLGDRVKLIGILNIIVGLACGTLWLVIARPLLTRARNR